MLIHDNFIGLKEILQTQFERNFYPSIVLMRWHMKLLVAAVRIIQSKCTQKLEASSKIHAHRNT